MVYFIKYTVESAMGRKVPSYFETSHLDKFVEAFHRALKSEFIEVMTYGTDDGMAVKEEYTFNPNT